MWHTRVKSKRSKTEIFTFQTDNPNLHCFPEAIEMFPEVEHSATILMLY